MGEVGSYSCFRQDYRIFEIYNIRAAASHDQENEGCDADDETDQLRGRETGQRSQTKNVAARVVAYKFDGEADDRVEQRVSENDLAAEAFAFVQPQQKQK